MPRMNPDGSFRARKAATLLTCLFAALSSPLVAQDPEDKPPGPDPFTRMEEDKIKAAGYVQYGPFRWRDDHSTDDILTVLGTDRMLFVETPHFKIGIDLIGGTTASLAENRDARKKLYLECRDLRKQLRGFPSKPTRLDRWMMLHLYAHRLEGMYAKFLNFMNLKDGDFGKAGSPATTGGGTKQPFMANGQKINVLILEQRGSMSRYLQRWSNVQTDLPYAHIFDDGGVVILTAKDCFEGDNQSDAGVHAGLAAMVGRSLISAYRGNYYNLPLWVTEGVAHMFSRDVDDRYYNAIAELDQDPEYRNDHDWEKRVRARVGYDYYRAMSEQMELMEPGDMDFADHMMAWSRMKYITEEKKGALRSFLDAMTTIPLGPTGVKPEQVLERQKTAFPDAFGMSPDEFDEAWHKHVLKTYKRR